MRAPVLFPRRPIYPQVFPCAAPPAHSTEHCSGSRATATLKHVNLIAAHPCPKKGLGKVSCRLGSFLCANRIIGRSAAEPTNSPMHCATPSCGRRAGRQATRQNNSHCCLNFKPVGFRAGNMKPRPLRSPRSSMKSARHSKRKSTGLELRDNFVNDLSQGSACSVRLLNPHRAGCLAREPKR